MAGQPNLAYEEIQGYIDTDDLFLGRLSQDDVFALRVKGDSMIEAGIIEGDIAVIKKQPTAFHREIVAALLDNNEVTLKRVSKSWPVLNTPKYSPRVSCGIIKNTRLRKLPITGRNILARHWLTIFR